MLARQVGDLGGGELTIVAGSANGHLSRLRLACPLAPGSDPSEVQVIHCYHIRGLFYCRANAPSILRWL
jgi:hypothetical protein